MTTPTTVVEYESDARGLRQSRIEGATTHEFVWSTAGGLPLLLDDGTHRYVYGPTLTPIAQLDGVSGDIEYLHTDMLGTPRLITSDTGVAVGITAVDAYGNRTGHTGSADSAIGFTGNWTDAATGLVYLRARDYDPSTGQFLTVDPLVDETRYPYAYVANNPLVFTDPTGLDFWGDAGANLLAFGAGVLNGVTFGLSDMILGATVPDYDCFVQKHSAFHTAGDVVGMIVSTVVITVATAGAGAGVAAVAIAARVATRAATTAVISGAKVAVAAATRAASRVTGSTVVRSAERSAVAATNNGAGGATTLFRHVSQAELDDILGNGFRAGNGSMEGKWFAEVADDAAEWGARLNGGQGSIVHVQALGTFVNRLQRIDRLDGIGPARYVEPDILGMLNQFPWEILR